MKLCKDCKHCRDQEPLGRGYEKCCSPKNAVDHVAGGPIATYCSIQRFTRSQTGMKIRMTGRFAGCLPCAIWPIRPTGPSISRSMTPDCCFQPRSPTNQMNSKPTPAPKHRPTDSCGFALPSRKRRPDHIGDRERREIIDSANRIIGREWRPRG